MSRHSPLSRHISINNAIILRCTLMLFPLSKMSPGQTAVISWVSDNTSISKRLMDLGFEPEASVSCILKKKNGELSAFLIRGAVIALRREDAELVLVEEKEATFT